MNTDSEDGRIWSGATVHTVIEDGRADITGLFSYKDRLYAATDNGVYDVTAPGTAIAIEPDLG